MTYIIIMGVLLLLGYLYLKSLNTASSSNTPKFTNISPDDAKELITSSDLQALDVRTSNETSGGMISKALHVNVNSASTKSKIEKLDKNQAYLVYCRSGRRSINACNIMSGQGFLKLYNLEGGYNAWK